MALRNMRARIRVDGARRGRLFRSPPHIGRVLFFGAVSAVAFAYSAALLLRGEERLGIFFVAVMFGLYALDNWRRLTLDKPEDPNLESATEFVEENSRREREPAATWQCPTCGEHIQEQFGACWKCNSEPERG